MGGKEIQFSNTVSVNIAGTGGMIRSGRVFVQKYNPKVTQTPMVVPTPSSQAGTSIFIPIIPVGTPSSFMTKGTSSSTAEAATSWYGCLKLN